MDLRKLWLPLAHRLFPTIGPGGAANALSLVLHSDASRMVHVTRYMDVAEVWSRDDDFSVRGYGERMGATTGPFILGMDDLDRYTKDATVIRSALRRDDAALVRRIVAEETAQAMDRVRKVGRIDIVRDLANVVPIRFSMRYFGLPEEDLDELLRRFQVASWYIFSFWFDPRMRDAAVSAAEDVRGTLAKYIEQRRREGDIAERDVIGRLLAASNGFADGDVGVLRSIAGLCSGTLNAPIGLFVNGMNKLVSLPEHERRTLHVMARRAVAGSERDDRSFRDYLREAERFGVFPSVLYRHAEHDTALAAGTSREKKIPAGTTVVIWPSLAAFDRDVFESPFEFIPGRPRWKYMGFGHGRHACLGEHIGQTLLHEMARALFALPRLRRGPGRAGTVRTLPVEQANFPSSFVLEFDKVS